MTPRHHLVVLAALVAICASPAPARAFDVTDPVHAPVEPCRLDLAAFHQPPAELLDCNDANCVRLMPVLRSAARTGDAQEVLLRAADELYFARHPELRPGSVVVARALADLAVTGRAAYASFQSLAPTEAALAASLRLRLSSAFPAHVQAPGDVSSAVEQTLHRAYQVAWALRGPMPYRTAHRARLGWIAVDAEDDPPHRPVNVDSAPFAQRDMTVRVDGIDVTTRYLVASRQVTDDHPVDVTRVPPDREHPLVIGDVILFIHGHSSLAEEVVTLADALIAQGEARGRPVTVISMDLPSNGYATMIEHTAIAPIASSRWNTGYPILDFIERFVVAFVDGLDARQPGIKDQIVGVIGGSLGGNMTLRLGRRDPATHPWLRNVVSWSPASSWGSWARANDAIKPGLAAATRGRMGEAEGDGSVHDFFHGVGGRASQGGHWYSDSWGCTTNALTASHRGVYEIYNSRFRRWHWRVAYEQLIFSHWDSDNPDPGIDPDPERDARSGPARYAQIRSRLLLAAGYDDDAWPEKIFSFTLELAGRMRTRMAPGSAFFVKDTGHSIHAEKPAFFAGRILDFLFESPLPPFPAFLVPAIG